MKLRAAIYLLVALLAGIGVFFTLLRRSAAAPTAPLPNTLKEPPEQPVVVAPNPVSLPALAAKQFDGRNLQVGRVLENNSIYTRYYITYLSGQLKISGIMNVPKGDGPFPVLILNHGYIDTAIYMNGRGLKREQDYLARHGYAVIHPDYRNHADSDKDPDSHLSLRLGYTEDAINAVYAVRAADLPYFDKEHIGMLGHSMGGGIALNVITAAPDLIDAAVLFAPVSADYRDNFNKWTRTRPDEADAIIAAYGTPTSSPEFWDSISPINFLDRIQAPVLLHHGGKDESVPLVWSEKLTGAMETAGKEVTFYVYPDEPHEFINA